MTESVLFSAVQTANVATENGCVAHSSTLNACLDFFGQVGASRGLESSILPKFLKAFCEDQKTATQILFWLRDIRGGQGERDLFKAFIPYVVTKENIDRILTMILEVGRVDDMFIFIGTEFERNVLRLLAKEINAKNGLVAKWIPRKKGVFENLRKYMKMEPKQLREKLVELTNVVETKMSEGKFKDINYQAVPSRASLIYKKAFMRHDEKGYTKFIEKVNSGEAKINAKTLYPYEIVLKSKNQNYKNDDVLEAIWKALPNYMEGKSFNILPLIDVSGSMDSLIPKNKNLNCMDIAISLGLYVAERNETVFKDQFITFSDNPEMLKVKGTLANKLKIIRYSKWGGSTNVQATFKLILDAALRFNLKQEDLPTHLIIFSDMEFNQISDGGNGTKHSKTLSAFKWAKSEFKKNGYKLPKIVFWNLKSSVHYPVQEKTTGTMIVSGFNPSLMTTILSGDEVKEPTPMEKMLETVNKERYTI